MLTVTVRGPDMEPLHLVEDLTSLEWQTKHLGLGGWVMTLPADGQSSDLLRRPDVGITVTDSDDMVLLSGPVEVSLPDAGAVDQTITPDGGVLTITGTDDMGWLADRIVVPPTPSSRDTHTGTAGAVVAAFVDAHAGPGAGARAVPGLQVPVSAVGPEITHSARFSPLLEVVAEVAAIGGLRAVVSQVGRTLALAVEETSDLSGAVLYSIEAGNLAAARVATSVARSTALYVGGQGQGAAREVVEVAAAGVRRRESFLDRRDLATTAQLEAAGAVALEKNSGSVSVSVQPIADGGAVFGVDFRLGDLVGVEVGGVRTAQRVTASTWRLSPSGVEHTITVGASASYGASALLRSAENTRQRLAPLEHI